MAAMAGGGSGTHGVRQLDRVPINPWLSHNSLCGRSRPALFEHLSPGFLRQQGTRSPIGAPDRRSPANSVTMSGDKQLEQANLDAVVLLKELEDAAAKINAALLARCDAVLFQW